MSNTSSSPCWLNWMLYVHAVSSLSLSLSLRSSRLFPSEEFKIRPLYLHCLFISPIFPNFFERVFIIVRCVLQGRIDTHVYSNFRFYFIINFISCILMPITWKMFPSQYKNRKMTPAYSIWNLYWFNNTYPSAIRFKR